MFGLERGAGRGGSLSDSSVGPTGAIDPEEGRVS